MAFTIAVAQQKGGAGKTTLACNLAVALQNGHPEGDAFRTALIDLDAQRSLSYWSAQRVERFGDDRHIECRAAETYQVRSEITRLSRSAEVIILDTPPHLDNVARQAIRLADLVLIPMQPSPLDLHATVPTAELITKERRPCRIVLNRVTPRAKLAVEVVRRAAEIDIPLTDSRLGSRTVFAAAMMDGKGVVEAAPSSPAAREVWALADEVRALAGEALSLAA